VGECFFWYWLTRVVPDKRPLNGCVCVCVCVLVIILLSVITLMSFNNLSLLRSLHSSQPVTGVREHHSTMVHTKFGPMALTVEYSRASFSGSKTFEHKIASFHSYAVSYFMRASCYMISSIFLTCDLHCSVPQNKPDYQTFQPTLRKFA